MTRVISGVKIDILGTNCFNLPVAVLIRGSCVLILIAVLGLCPLWRQACAGSVGAAGRHFPWLHAETPFKVKLESKPLHIHLSAVHKLVSSRGLHFYCTIFRELIHISFNFNENCVAAAQKMIPQVRA